MNLSDASSDEEPTPGKRPRAETYGTSSTTTHGSAFQVLDNEPDIPNSDLDYLQQPPKISGKYSNYFYGGKINFWNKGSLNEDCSSPSDQVDGYNIPGGDETDKEREDEFHRPSFQNINDSSYTKDFNEIVSYKGEYSDVAINMMSNMGYKHGHGLGKYEHGRIEPVLASTHKGRRGLGLKPSAVGDLPQDFQWTPDESEPQFHEEVLWMNTALDEPPTADLLEKWLTLGPEKLSVDETDFVEPHILKGVLEAKTIFDSLDNEDLRNARYRSNPYETIGSVIFINRAAVKMANIDAICDFMFTSPKSETGKDILRDKQILYFADVCAGPGGFSEYVLYRKGWRAKGFGFTLQKENDFKVHEFYAGPPDTFSTYYGAEGDGDIYKPENLISLKDHVIKQTENKGVHFLMADGGFQVEGQENLQEILSKQLYLCQCIAALMLVRTGGHFVVKLFDVFTIFSVGLIYIMHRCFNKVAIHKPVTSRPANSERYLICLYKRSGTKATEDYLFRVNTLLFNKAEGSPDVLELVPLEIIKQDREFYEYIYKSNCMIGEKQIKNLLKMAAFSKDKDLKEIAKQDHIKAECLKLWMLPNHIRTPIKYEHAENTLKSIIAELNKSLQYSLNNALLCTNILGKPPDCMKMENDLNKIKNVYDWYFVFLSSDKNSSDLKIFLGCGNKQVFKYDTKGWTKVTEAHLSLPAKTLLYGEILKEYSGEGGNQIYNKCLHVIDALMLGGVDISQESLTDRMTQCELFCTALNKPFDSTSLPIRCKRMYGLEHFPNVVQRLKCHAMKRIKKAVTVETPERMTDIEKYYAVGSVLLMKEIKEPWSAQMSKKNHCKYYYAVKNNRPQSVFEIPPEAKLDMLSTYCKRIIWPWESSAVAILTGDKHSGLTRAQLENYIKHNVIR